MSPLLKIQEHEKFCDVTNTSDQRVYIAAVKRRLDTVTHMMLLPNETRTVFLTKQDEIYAADSREELNSVLKKV